MGSWRRGGALFFFSLLLALPLGGCLIATEDTLITPQISFLFGGTYKIDPAMEKRRPRSVAVLPFLNQSESQAGSEAVRRGFYNHFSSLPFQDQEIYRTDEQLRKAGLTDPAEIRKLSPQELGRILGVEAVVYGDISNFDKLFAIVYSQVSVGAEVKMFDTGTGQFLWSGQHVVRIHEGGLSTTPIGIIATVIATAMNVRDIQLLRACDDLFREMVKTIPVPALADALRPPAISLLVQDTQSRPRKAGDEIRVVLQGAPKMRASFDIGAFRQRIEMVEQEEMPGAYLGIYRVLPGDNVAGALVTGRLTDDAGNSAEWVDALGTVTLDTTPPPKPGPPETVGRDKLVLLAWEKSPVTDLAAYRLYRSLTPLSGYEPILRTEFTEYRDAGLLNGQRYYYQLTALDRAGNESERSPAVAGMPVAPGPTPVGGAIEADTTWVAGASPYVIESEVLVRDRAVLTIEPGTEVRSRGGALVIEGQLRARGDAERLILFGAAAGTASWGGIRFVNVKERENLLRHIRVRQAAVGITCEASSPRIETCELTENGTALSIRGAFSAPLVTGNMIHRNEATAVLISEGAKPILTGNRILDNAAAGIVVTSGAPEILKNAIAKNRGGGIVVNGAQTLVSQNNLTDNTPFDLSGEMTGAAVAARNNWWGTAKGLEVFARIRGKVDVRSILDAPHPQGRPLALPILTSPLSGPLTADAYLILSESPYRVAGDLVVGGGAVLFVEPGVVLQYDRSGTITIEDGGVIARGTATHPILFTAAGAAPVPGAYPHAIRWTKPTGVHSVVSHAAVRFANTAFDVYHGTPEISYCHIAASAQGGIFCRNDAAPRISFCTFEGNRGEGAIKAVGMSNPSIQRSNFIGNAVAIQGFSSIYIDARNNWWGASPPNPDQIWGDPEKGVNIKPWLETPEAKAFREKK